MKKFLVLEDIDFFGTIVLEKGETCQIDKSLNISKKDLKFSIPIEDVIKDSRFKEIHQQEIQIREITEEEDEEIKKYRIQLDVTTSRKKLVEIENFLRKTIEEMI